MHTHDYMNPVCRATRNATLRDTSGSHRRVAPTLSPSGSRSVLSGLSAHGSHSASKPTRAPVPTQRDPRIQSGCQGVAELCRDCLQPFTHFSLAPLDLSPDKLHGLARPECFPPFREVRERTGHQAEQSARNATPASMRLCEPNRRAALEQQERARRWL